METAGGRIDEGFCPIVLKFSAKNEWIKIMNLKISETLCRWKKVLLRDEHIRMQMSLYFGLMVNLIYAGFKLINGIHYQSLWFVAVAVFYAVLSFMRFVLIWSMRKSTQKEERQRYIHGVRSYRLCGYLMFLLNIAMCGIVIQMIWKNESYRYPGYIIYLSALYAFICLISAIKNVLRYRDMHVPELAATKLLSLAKSCMSLLAMQTAMFTQFGNDAPLRQFMNSVSGGCVCTIIICMAIYMVVRAEKELKKLK